MDAVEYSLQKLYNGIPFPIPHCTERFIENRKLVAGYAQLVVQLAVQLAVQLVDQEVSTLQYTSAQFLPKAC